MTEEIKSLKYMYRSRGLPDGYHHIMTFVLRFVSKRGAFCMETECVLYQNGRRFDTKWEDPLPPKLTQNLFSYQFFVLSDPVPQRTGRCLHEFCQAWAPSDDSQML